MKTSVTIRMGAAYHDCAIKQPKPLPTIHFNFRVMSKDEKRVFHREFMNAFRAARFS